MDFALDIVIPKAGVWKVNLKEQLIEWGGESFSQNPRRYKTDSNLIFEEILDTKYYCNLIGSTLNMQSYIALSLQRKQLLEMEYIINQQREKIKDNELLIFLKTLVLLDNFYVFLLQDDEGIEKHYVVKGKEDLTQKICSSLDWSTPCGVLLTK